MTSPIKDFDPDTGKLVPVAPSPRAGKDKEPPLANPLKLAPTGSKQGKLALADWLRAAATFVMAFGSSDLLVKALEYAGNHPGDLGTYGPLIAAASMALAHVLVARQANNTH